MKKTLIIIIGIVSIHAMAQSSFNFSINGSFKNAKENTKIFIHHKWDEGTFTDSSRLKGGKFVLNGKSSEPNMYWITKTNNPNEQPNLIFFVDAGKTIVTGNLDSLSFSGVSGGTTQKDYIDYNSLMGSFSIKQQAIVNAYNEAKNKGDTNTMNQKVGEYQALDVEVKSALAGFISNHSKSPISGYAIYYNFQNATGPIEELEKIVNLLDKNTENTKYGKLGREKLKQMRGTMIGYEALNFSQADVNGKKINLKDFKGKYVLVDFWASWCGPCRGENPNVVNAYNKYKDKGFTVLGVSFDQDKGKWLQAIEKDHLTWTQVSDLKGWGNEAGKLFGITSIPQNLLLDKEGKIVAKNLRGIDLENKLEEIIK